MPCGIALIVCALAYVNSFLATPTESMFSWSIVLFAGIFANIVAVYAVEWPRLDGLRLTRGQLMRDMPRWVNWWEIALAIMLVAHFLWMVREAGLGVPAIVDGQYVVESRGRILEVITESDYIHLKCIEFRIGAVLFLAIYFSLTMYWWFHKSRKGLR